MIRDGSHVTPSSKLRRITMEDGVASVEWTRACANNDGINIARVSIFRR